MLRVCQWGDSSAGAVTALWATDVPSLGGRTDLDGFLLHLVAHVGGLDLGYTGKLVLRVSWARVPFSYRGDARGRWEGRGWGQQ